MFMRNVVICGLTVSTVFDTLMARHAKQQVDGSKIDSCIHGTVLQCHDSSFKLHMARDTASEAERGVTLQFLTR